MQLLYKECYDIKTKTICPFIQISYSKEEQNIIPSFEIKYEYYDMQEDVFIIDVPFSNGIFSNITKRAKKIIDTIFSFSLTLTKKNYINSDVWSYFLFTSNIKINPIEKGIKTRLTDKINKSNIRYKDLVKLQNYYSDFDDDKKENISNSQVQLSKLFYDSYSIKKDSKTDNIKLKYNMIKFNSKDFNQEFLNKKESNADMIITYSSFCKNELELIYSFLNIIFSTNHDYKLFTCFNCGNFFVDTHASYLNCTYCRKVVQKEQKKNYDKKPIVILENRIDSQYYNDHTSKEERAEYLKEKKIAKGKYKNDEEKLTKWYLSKDKKRKKITN